jgi:phage baseplate assembly protein W
MGSFSFKSVGKTQIERTEQQLSASSLPVGIKTPLELGSIDGIFLMHHNIADQVNDNLQNLIKTNFGERLGLYAFGANLRPLVTEWTTLDDFDARAMQRISAAIQKWMPYVSLENYTSRLDTTEHLGTIVKVAISYNVPALGVLERSIEVSFRVM